MRLTGCPGLRRKNEGGLRHGEVAVDRNGRGSAGFHHRVCGREEAVCREVCWLFVSPPRHTEVRLAIPWLSCDEFSPFLREMSRRSFL